MQYPVFGQVYLTPCLQQLSCVLPAERLRDKRCKICPESQELTGFVIGSQLTEPYCRITTAVIACSATAVTL